MSEAPERIWADGNAEWDSGSWGRDKEYDEDVEYIRADLVEPAVKLAIEAAADVAEVLDDPAPAIRALDPAQFIKEPKP